MAIAVGSFVALARNSSLEVFGDEPTFGRVYGGASPDWDVLWDSGRTENVPELLLDEVVFEAVEPAVFRDTDPIHETAQVDYIKLSQYTRDGTSYVLGRNIHHGFSLEVLATLVEDLEGR
jgi:hypothetical protein